MDSIKKLFGGGAKSESEAPAQAAPAPQQPAEQAPQEPPASQQLNQ